MSNLFDISGGMQQGVPVYTPSWFSATWRVCNRAIRLGSYYCHSNSTIEDWGVNQYKRRDNTQGCRELGIPYFGEFNYVQVGGQHYPNRDTFSVGESSLVVQTVWNNRCCNVPTFRRSRYCSCNSIRIFWYYWYCYLQGWHQHQRCKLVQSGSTTHSLR